MSVFSIFDAKTHLSRLIEAVESGAESEIIIARNGRPAARPAPITNDRRLQLGAAKGVAETPAPDPAIEKRAADLVSGDT